MQESYLSTSDDAKYSENTLHHERAEDSVEAAVQAINKFERRKMETLSAKLTGLSIFFISCSKQIE